MLLPRTDCRCIAHSLTAARAVVTPCALGGQNARPVLARLRHARSRRVRVSRPPCASTPAAPVPDAVPAVPSAAGNTQTTVAEASAAATVVRVMPGVFNGDLRDLPLARQWMPGDPIIDWPRRTTGVVTAPAALPKSAAADPAADALDDGTTRVPGDLPPGDIVPLSFSPPDLDFDGSVFTGRVPPDPVGDVGSQHYIQMVNHPDGSEVTVYDKTGTVQAGPFVLDSLWAAGGECANGRGDPIVLYDAAADRWLLSEMTQLNAVPVGLCVYVSRTPNPVTGGWFNHAYPVDAQSGLRTARRPWPLPMAERSALFGLRRFVGKSGQTATRLLGIAAKAHHGDPGEWAFCASSG